MNITQMNTGDLEVLHRQASRRIMELVQERSNLQRELQEVIAEQHAIRIELDQRADRGE